MTVRIFSYKLMAIAFSLDAISAYISKGMHCFGRARDVCITKKILHFIPHHPAPPPHLPEWLLTIVLVVINPFFWFCFVFGYLWQCSGLIILALPLEITPGDKPCARQGPYLLSYISVLSCYDSFRIFWHMQWCTLVVVVGRGVVPTWCPGCPEALLVSASWDIVPWARAYGWAAAWRL